MSFNYFSYSQGEFRLCDSSKWRVYWVGEYGKDRYRLESKVVKNYIRQTFKAQFDTTQNGYITFRYHINCQGKAGKYSILQVDKNYNKVVFRKEITEGLMNIVAGLDIYKQKKDYQEGARSEPIDYFIFLSFKIKNGEIEAILP